MGPTPEHALTREALEACGSLQTGHFQLSSGRHSDGYVQCALYLAEPRRAEAAGRQLAAALGRAGLEPQLVVAPAMGGLIIGHEVARALGTPFLFTERKDGVMCLRRGFEVGSGQTLVVIEDVVTTGRSTREVIDILDARGATTLGVGSLIDRTGRARPFGDLPHVALLELGLPSWPADACPLCRAGRPIAHPGSRPLGPA
jgi:orotate phosphoribosyltransferase